MAQFSFVFENLYILCTLAIAVTLGLSFRLYPIIIYVVNAKGLMDDPGERSSHSSKVPTLGGMGLFIVFSLTILLLGVLADLTRPELLALSSLLAATLLLLIMGVKDDLVFMSPKKKLVGQLLAASMVIFLSDLRITHFFGLLGVGELPYWFSVGFTFFVFILVINAMNLIDGIDGLAGAITIVASTVFGIFFLLNGQYLYSLLSFALIGAIIGFLNYNLSNTKKLFMGDSGSLLIGFLLAYQGVCFLDIHVQPTNSFAVPNAPIVLLAVLSYPLLDTLRVFSIRVRKGRSPFSADRNHIHHRLLDLGNSHELATLYLSICNVLIILLVLLMGNLENNIQLIISVLVGSCLYLTPFLRKLEGPENNHGEGMTEPEFSNDVNPISPKNNSQGFGSYGIIRNGSNDGEPLKDNPIAMESGVSKDSFNQNGPMEKYKDSIKRLEHLNQHVELNLKGEDEGIRKQSY